MIGCQKAEASFPGFVVPENFAMVETGVYRCSFPRSKNIPFLKTLNLKSVVSLVPEEYPLSMMEFYNSEGIELLSHGLEGNKWPFKESDYKSLCSCMRDVMSSAKRPVLIHCNKGKHRTGTVIGCLRKERGKNSINQYTVLNSFNTTLTSIRTD